MKRRGGLFGKVLWVGATVATFLVGKRLVPEARRYLRMRRM